jgi:hypothetical protein
MEVTNPSETLIESEVTVGFFRISDVLAGVEKARKNFPCA